MKKILHGKEAREAILEGAEELYQAVKTTLGPKGGNVIIDKYVGLPSITHDGVTVAKSIDIEGPANVGVKLIKQASNKMNDVVGDGTTTVTVLTYHILNEANKLIAAGHNPMVLKKELDKSAHTVLKGLDTLVEDVTPERVEQIASISSGDAELGKIVAEVVNSTGKDGVVTVEQGQGLEVFSETVEGYSFARGYASPYMVTNEERLEAVYSKPPILVYNKELTTAQQLAPILERLLQAGVKDLVIFAPEIRDEALSMVIFNKVKGAFNVLAVQANDEQLQDIAKVTGTEIILDSLSGVVIDELGAAKKVIATGSETTIVEGAGDTKDYIDNLEAQGEAERAARLKGQVAVINVGGATETEIEEKQYRVEDAVAASKAALESGIVTGGGVTQLKLSQATDGILAYALRQPFIQLMKNAGEEPAVLLNNVLNAKEGMGYDARDTTKLIDLKKEGIVDPAKVTREAIQNAVSIAGNTLTMGALVYEEGEEEEPQPIAIG